MTDEGPINVGSSGRRRDRVTSPRRCLHALFDRVIARGCTSGPDDQGSGSLINFEGPRTNAPRVDVKQREPVPARKGRTRVDVPAIGDTLAYLTEFTPASGRRLAAIQAQWRRRGSRKTGMSGQHERGWNVSDNRHAVGQIGQQPDQECAQRGVRRSERLGRRSRRSASGNEEREQVVASDALRVYKPRKHGCKKRMVEYSARELARRRPMNARRQRTRERRIGERVEVKGSRHWRNGTGGTR